LLEEHVQLAYLHVSWSFVSFLYDEFQCRIMVTNDDNLLYIWLCRGGLISLPEVTDPMKE
jgi:hypothetical protein